MQVTAIWIVLLAAVPASAQEAVTETGEPEPQTDLRLTLSSFMFRETGEAAPPLVPAGEAVQTASPVRRYFGDLRAELSDGGFELDARVRQTTGERYQSGAGSGSEYELRTLRLRVGSPATALYVGRQYVDAVGQTKIDGVAVVRALTETWSGTLFGGALPALGSRSVDTDYPEIRTTDGTSGGALVPVTGGVGVAYSTGTLHGNLGGGAVYAAQTVPGATSSEASRVFVTADGYARPAKFLDVYHYLVADVAGNAGANLTNGSLGINVQAAANVQITAKVDHVSADVLQIAARSSLEDPDPNAMGVVQNNISIVRVSQDAVRGGASVAFAHQRFEVSVASGLRRRPSVSVETAGGMTVAFPATQTADASITLLDRRSIAKLRVTGTATVFYPLADAAANRSRGTLVRLAAGRVFAAGRGEIDADVMVERFRDQTGRDACATSMDVFACYGAARITAGQAGVLASWRAGREWLVIADTHLGVRDVTTATAIGEVESPRAFSITAFARLQWRYR